MKRKWFSFSRELTSKMVFDKMPQREQELLNKFKDYIMVSASEKRAEAGLVEVIRFRVITGKSLFEINLEDLRYFLKELRASDFGDHTKNKIKDYVQRFLKWNYKDWSERFEEFKDIKTNTDAQRKKQITDKELLTSEQIKKLLDAEPTLYWKTFLMVQSEGALRTGEARTLKWDNIIFEDDGFTTLNIPSRKNKNGSIKIKPVVVKIAGRFLKELQEQQDKFELKSSYVFPSPQDPNKPISKAVNLWFNQLCQKVLGKPSFNYILRHSKGTELQKKVREGKLSKDNAVEFMRHSEKMFDKVYSHMSQDAIKVLMKKQIYNTKALTQEENNKIKILEQQFDEMQKQIQHSTKINERTLFLLEKLKEKYPNINLFGEEEEYLKIKV